MKNEMIKKSGVPVHSFSCWRCMLPSGSEYEFAIKNHYKLIVYNLKERDKKW
jgi:hypothetical protein